MQTDECLSELTEDYLGSDDRRVKRKYRRFIHSQPRRWTSNETPLSRERDGQGKRINPRIREKLKGQNIGSSSN
jgi:hypothetical protein